MEQKETKLFNDNGNVCVFSCNIRVVFYDSFLLS